MNPELGVILDVLADGSCNVQGDHDAQYVADVYATNYTPARGDQVYVVFVDGAAIILGARGARRQAVPTVTVRDSAPTGDNLRQITSWWQNTDAGDAPATVIGVRSSPPTPSSVGGGTPSDPITPSAAGSWDEVNGFKYGDVIQGQVAGFPHPRTGLWFYSSLVDGHTATGLTIRVHRKLGSGPGGNVSLRFYLHGETGAPTGMPTLYESFDGDGSYTLSPDATSTFTLPAEWAALLAAGTRTGVAISSTAAADYCRCDDGALTFTFAS